MLSTYNPEASAVLPFWRLRKTGLSESLRQSCTLTQEAITKADPHAPIARPQHGVRDSQSRTHRPLCSSDLYGNPQPPSPEPIVSPGDNTDKGPSLVGCLHQSVTMGTHRETILKPALSPPACSCGSRNPAPAEGAWLVIVTPPPTHPHQIGHSWAPSSYTYPSSPSPRTAVGKGALDAFRTHFHRKKVSSKRFSTG